MNLQLILLAVIFLLSFGNNEDTQFASASFGSTVELDQIVYSRVDKVYAVVISPDQNMDPYETDYVTVDVYSDSDDGLSLTFVETDNDTGIFVGDFNLGTRFSNDKLFVRDGDEIFVAYYDDYTEETIIGSAIVRSNIGEILWLEDATIRLIDPDLNENSYLVDDVQIRVYSDSDSGGIFVTLKETNEATGIFEGKVSFAELFVRDGDEVMVEYVDRTLPEPYSEYDALEITSTATYNEYPSTTQQFENEMQVFTDKNSYGDGEIIHITGITQNNQQGDVILHVTAPNDNLVTVTQIPVSYDNTFETRLTAGGPLWKSVGVYTINAYYGTPATKSTTSFRFTGVSTSPESVYDYNESKESENDFVKKSEPSLGIDRSEEENQKNLESEDNIQSLLIILVIIGLLGIIGVLIFINMNRKKQYKPQVQTPYQAPQTTSSPPVKTNPTRGSLPAGFKPQSVINPEPSVQSTPNSSPNEEISQENHTAQNTNTNDDPYVIPDVDKNDFDREYPVQDDLYDPKQIEKIDDSISFHIFYDQVRKEKAYWEATGIIDRIHFHSDKIQNEIKIKQNKVSLKIQTLRGDGQKFAKLISGGDHDYWDHDSPGYYFLANLSREEEFLGKIIIKNVRQSYPEMSIYDSKLSVSAFLLREKVSYSTASEMLKRITREICDEINQKLGSVTIDERLRR